MNNIACTVAAYLRKLSTDDQQMFWGIVKTKISVEQSHVIRDCFADSRKRPSCEKESANTAAKRLAAVTHEGGDIPAVVAKAVKHPKITPAVNGNKELIDDELEEFDSEGDRLFASFDESMRSRPEENFTVPKHLEPQGGVFIMATGRTVKVKTTMDKAKSLFKDIEDIKPVEMDPNDEI